jgi:hypothetical protein
MPTQEVLIMALTQMRGGICTAGFLRARDPLTGLKWVRPVREHDSLLVGDLTDADGRLVQCGDVVELNLLRVRPQPPHIEDWVADFTHHRPRVLRRLEDARWADFLEQHVDPAPADVLVQHTRSLCLVRPESVWASFALDTYSGKYETRLGFSLPGDANHPQAAGPRGLVVTDLKWRKLGRSWLRGERSPLRLEQRALLDRLGAGALYLVLGLSRFYQNQYWPMVVGVHPTPGYVLEVTPADVH